MRTKHTGFRATLVALTLLAQLSAAAAGVCLDGRCDMSPPPVDTIVAACCCEAECDSLVAADTAMVPAEDLKVSTHGAAPVVRGHVIPVVPIAAVANSIRATPATSVHLFQLYRSYRL